MSHFKLILAQILMTLGTIFLVLGTVATLSNAFAYVFSGTAYQEFFGDRDPFGSRYDFAMFHIMPAAAALVIGPFQFSKLVRRTKPVLHRIAGSVYALCVLTSASASLFLAPHSIGGLEVALGFGTLAILWLITTIGGLFAVVKAKYAQHRNRMLRSYVLTCAGVLFRIELVILNQLAGLPYESAYRFSAWACWPPTLILLELWIRKKQMAKV